MVRALRFEEADAVVRAALGVRFTAAVLRVEHGGCGVFERAYGAVDETGSEPVYVTSRFDLASLTKLFVATIALELAEAGTLSLDGSLLGFLPEWRGSAHEPITLRMLLAHTSGMQSGADYRTLLDDAVTHYALTRPLVAAPGDRVIYSDLGYIALGVLIERAVSRSLGASVARMAAHLGTRSLSYHPAAADVAVIPATEDDGWRGRVRGVVHDEKAYLMNGIAGHAGLFGTASDVALLTETFLGPVRGRKAKLLGPALVRESIAEQAPDALLRRGLGWALKTSDENSCGARMSEDTFGHTGFTGTCVWADPQRDLQIVFLTNALYFGRTDLRRVRAAVCDAVSAEFERC